MGKVLSGKLSCMRTGLDYKGYNIHFRSEIKKIVQELSSKPHLTWNSDFDAGLLFVFLH